MVTVISANQWVFFSVVSCIFPAVLVVRLLNQYSWKQCA